MPAWLRKAAMQVLVFLGSVPISGKSYARRVASRQRTATTKTDYKPDTGANASTVSTVGPITTQLLLS